MMTKYWDAGTVKTRLGKSIGFTRSAALHRLFVFHLLKSLATFQGRRIVCFAPDSRMEAFHTELRDCELFSAWETTFQANGSLGNRMQNWFETVFGANQPVSQAILIGADCPTIDLPLIEQARNHLISHDVVIGPAADGGYFLIGIAAPWTTSRFQTIFEEIPWSTEEVLPLTRLLLAAAGLSWHELAVQEDIDTLAELTRLRSKLSATRAAEPLTLNMFPRGQSTGDLTGELASQWEDLRIGIDKILAEDTDSLDTAEQS